MNPEWQPSVFYVEGVVDVPIERAWSLMIDYRAYNPTFEGATVEHVDGLPGAEGETVLITKLDHDPGVAASRFHCRTAKLQPPVGGAPAHIVWYLWDEAEELRNFVDFGLREDDRGVVFSIHYYAQGRLTGEALADSRTQFGGFLAELVGVFQRHCRERAA
jgi:hypothetical protein